MLTASGEASITNDTVVLKAEFLKVGAFGLFFKGNTTLLPGVPLGGANANGLLQVNTKIKRFGALQADANGEVFSSAYGQKLSVQSQVTTAGTVRNYQWWYRTPKKQGPCSNPSSGGSNSSNAYAITWGA